MDECQSCREVCLEAIAHCLQKGGRHAAATHITTLADCAEICTASASFMLRGSDLNRRVCEVCAEICEGCAKSCEQFGDDDMMRRCAEECRRCAESCRRMAAAGARA